MILFPVRAQLPPLADTCPVYKPRCICTSFSSSSSLRTSHMPPKRFVTQAGHRDAISCASSYAFNSGNKEAPWYGVQNRYLSDLLSPSMSLYPQYRLDLQSSLWQKRVKASSAPNSAAAPNPAAPSSTPPSIAAPPAAAEPRPSAPHSHAAGSPQPGDGPVDLHLDDNSDPDELDALTADTHCTYSPQLRQLAY